MKWAITDSSGVKHPLENIGIGSGQVVAFSDFNQNIPINCYCFLTWRGGKLYASIGCNNSYGTIGLYDYSSSEVEIDSSLGAVTSFALVGLREDKTPPKAMFRSRSRLVLEPDIVALVLR